MFLSLTSAPGLVTAAKKQARIEQGDSTELIYYDTNKSRLAPRSTPPHWRKADAPRATTVRDLFFPGRQSRLEAGRAQRLDADTAALLPPPPAFMMKREPVKELVFGQAALKDSNQKTAAVGAALLRMEDWLLDTQPGPLRGFRRRNASTDEDDLIRPLDGRERKPLVKWPAAVKGRPLLPAGKVIVGHAGVQVRCFRPGPPGVAANIPAHLGGTVRFPDAPESAPPAPLVGQIALEKLQRKQRGVWGRLRRRWREKRFRWRRRATSLPCVPADAENDAAESIAVEARGVVAKLKMQMAQQLSTVLDQQAALVAEHERVAQLERELDRQQHWQETQGRHELAAAAGGYITGAPHPYYPQLLLPPASTAAHGGGDLVHEPLQMAPPLLPSLTNEHGSRALRLPPLGTRDSQPSAVDASKVDEYEVRGIVRGDYMQITASSTTCASHNVEAPGSVDEYVSESGQSTAEAAAAVTSDEDENGKDQRYLSGDAAHAYHLQQQQRIYARKYPQQYDLHEPSQYYDDDSDVDDDEWPDGRLNPAYLAYGEDHQKPYSGSGVVVNPSGYLPQGVWRPEDNNMYDPEQEQSGQ